MVLPHITGVLMTISKLTKLPHRRMFASNVNIHTYTTCFFRTESIKHGIFTSLWILLLGSYEFLITRHTNPQHPSTSRKQLPKDNSISVYSISPTCINYIQYWIISYWRLFLVFPLPTSQFVKHLMLSGFLKMA